MTAEVIIAARGEVEANLIRTVETAAKSCEVCVVFDGDEVGNECPPKVKAQARVLRVEGAPMGCGYARHVGIDSSTADLIIILDGHSDLPKGWLTAIKKHHAHRKNHLTCCRMKSLNQDWTPTDDEPEAGAYIAYKTSEKFGIKYALAPKWNKDKKGSGEIACVMGACYAFRRSWYETIGKPLSILRAWGGDEELLSMSTHIMGGKVWLMPMIVGHVYAAKSNGRVKTADETSRIWGNRYNIIEALPMCEAEKSDLVQWMNKSNRSDHTLPPIPAEVATLKAVLATGTAPDWRKKSGIIVNYVEPVKPEKEKYKPPPAPINDKTQIVIRKQETCDRCGAVNPFVQIRGAVHTAAFGRAYARCKRCGHKGQLRIIR